MVTDKELIERGRKLHDRLNCNVSISGLGFKGDTELFAEKEDAMSFCWQAADRIEALTAELDEARKDNDMGREYMRTAWSEMNAIRARDGAPDGVNHEYWSDTVDALERLLGDEAKPWMNGAATELYKAANASTVAAQDEAEALAARVAELEGALADLRKNAELLQQNAEGCAVNHFSVDFEQQGFPGWLADTAASIERAIAALGQGESPAARQTEPPKPDYDKARVLYGPLSHDALIEIIAEREAGIQYGDAAVSKQGEKP